MVSPVTIFMLNTAFYAAYHINASLWSANLYL